MVQNVRVGERERELCGQLGELNLAERLHGRSSREVHDGFSSDRARVQGTGLLENVRRRRWHDDVLRGRLVI